ncbi:carboxypeptidase-like regulatory domain-containing protein [Cellulophaga baltica]|uniref:carboxypeptidase-like regulatory domain-containing protein n=1 Tax=Cellulophaga baltica TaxID=76594 RepID=UPI000471E696|nr:carboxypeptidase-like regulatory domain-containing protein [Cellulophaga baltica]AIY13299.1 outer membrane protein [Cellulophaga baltica NN016038]
MIKTSLYSVFFFICAASLYAQDTASKEIAGRVSSADGDVAATHVLNISLQKAAITDIDGFFTITARLNDTLVFSAVQFQRKELVMTKELLASKSLNINLEPSLNALDEVVVMPFNLSGQLGRDMNRIEIDPPLTAASLGLPNAFVEKMSQAERKAFSARSGGPLLTALNALTGETKRLRLISEREAKYTRTEFIRKAYHDSLYVKQLKIPADKINDFMYFCEIDSSFAAIDKKDNLSIWEFMLHKSMAYRKNYELD